MIQARFAVVCLSAICFVAHAACGGSDASPGGAPADGGSGDDAGGAGDGSILGDGAILGDGSTPPGDGGNVTRGAAGCMAIAIDPTTAAGTASRRFSFYDARCKLRTAAIASTTTGGYLRELTYDNAGATRTCTGTGSNGWDGWGYVVSHYGNGGSASTSNGTTTTQRAVLAGRHHAIQEVKVRVNPGGAVDATIHWLFATGRTHPLYSLTLDATPAGIDAVKADSRAPYGDMSWDGIANNSGTVDGVGWGDSYGFKTTGNGPVTMATPWDYTAANTVPYVLEWSNGADAEMGAVQTQSWLKEVAGGDYGGGAITTDCWGKTSANHGAACGNGQSMPPDYLWPFQLNQYELPFVTTSKRLAWGATFGAIGQASYTAFGKTLHGYPYLSYAVNVVFGKHTEGAVHAQVVDIETTIAASLRATKGTVATDGPAGPGRTDTMTYAPVGYDQVYGTWVVRADTNAATLVLTVASGKLVNPMIRVLDYTALSAPAHVVVAGRELVADVDYFATVDTAGKVLWLTLNASLAGAVDIAIR